MEELTRIYSVAKKLNSVYAMQKYIVKLGDKLNVHGFVPKNDLDNFKNTFESIDGVKLEVLPATSDVRLDPPTRLKIHGLQDHLECSSKCMVYLVTMM